jgi:hypothetical protein
MHWAATWILVLVLAAGVSVLLAVLYHTRFGTLLHEHIPERPRRRLFLASVSFFLTFLVVRLMVYAIEHHIPPFHYIILEGRHIHHLVFGILILLAVGYGWLSEIGTGTKESSLFVNRLMSLLYGVGAALTLDEFALWLNLKDVYWTSQGRTSIDAVILFGALLAIGAWGAPLFAALTGGAKRPNT